MKTTIIQLRSNTHKQKFKICKCTDNFHGFTLKQGCFFGEDSKGYFVSFGKRTNGRIIIYRINHNRINSICWEPHFEFTQEGTTAYKILTYLHDNPRHTINYGRENIANLFQSHVPQY